MSDPTAALYVRLPHPEFEKLHRAAEALSTNKKTLVTTLVSHYVDPDSEAGLDRLRTIAARPLPDVLTPGQAADLLQVSEEEVVELAEAGTLPGRRIGERWRFSRPALIAWLAGA